MRKWILILGVSLIVTGCSKSVSSHTTLSSAEVKTEGVISVDGVSYMEYGKGKDVYINDDTKKVILDINNLREKYKDNIDEREFDYLHINIYEDDHNRIKNINFDNNYIPSYEYFNELVEILDKSLAEGLKDYVINMKDKQLEHNENIIEKIGRTVVYVQNRGVNEDNYISIKINFLDVEDEYYRDIFNKVSGGKYILDNVVRGEKLNLININATNPNYYYEYRVNNLEIRYNMFLEDKDIEKVNILIKGKIGTELEYDDIGVFINLLNTLELKEGDKDILLNEYKNVVGKKVNKTIGLDNYTVLINSTKGNTYSDNNKDLIYFSIERN